MGLVKNMGVIPLLLEIVENKIVMFNYRVQKQRILKVCSIVFLLFFMLNIEKSSAQQDVQFSQYVFTGMALNPGYAGYKEETNFHLIYRNQWTGLTGAPKTIVFSMDGVTSDKRIGLGGSLVKDELGAQSSLSALGVFSYRLKLTQRARLSLGLAAGLDQYKIDESKLILDDKTDNLLGSLQASLIQPDLQFGVFYANPTYFASFSVTDLLANFKGGNPAYLVIYRNRHYYFQTGALLNIAREVKLKPSILFKEDFLGPTNLDMNLFLLFYDRFWLGASVRTGVKILKNSQLQSDLISRDAYSILAEFQVTDHLRIGYSFDYTANQLRDVNSGTHEISIGYTLKSRKTPILSPRYF